MLRLTSDPLSDKRELIYHILICILAGFMAALIVLPVLALLMRAFTTSVPEDILGSGAILNALTLSLGTTSISMVGIILFGTPLALVLARSDFPLKRILSIFIELPIVMPPVVAGLALLVTFGRRGLLVCTLRP
jgi:molybdate transport system permease protein